VALVVGTMNFGKRTPEPEAQRIVARALERGLDFFDTANVYNDGDSERILGRALRGKPARVATKMGIGKMSDPEGLAPERITAAIDESLRRLGTDRVDLYYFHKPDHSRPLEPSVRAMEKLVDAGKVRAWAVSNFASWQIADLLHFARIRPRVSQVLYNLLIRQLELEYFRFARTYAVHTTIYNPLAGGLLAGKPGARFENNPMYQRRYLTDRFFELAEAFARLASEAGYPLRVVRKTIPQDFHGYITMQPGVAGAVHFPHPARADGREDLVRAEARPGRKRHFSEEF